MVQAVPQRRVPQLDGIRGLAILLVVYWHYVAAPNALQPPGSIGRALFRIGILTWSGVDLFFVLSGFLIGGILIDAKHSRRYFQTFYIRRVFRILPLYGLLCWAGTALVMLNPRWGNVLGHPMPFLVYLTFTQNFWLAHHSWDAYMGPTWSLAVEEQFYLTLPFIVRFVYRRWLPFTIGAFALASILGRSFFYLHYGDDWGTAAYTLMFCRADALMFGVLGALAIREPRILKRLSEQRWILRSSVALSGACVGVLILKGWTMETRPMSTLGYSAVALFYLSLLLLAVARHDGAWARALRARPLMMFGNLAYCLYMVHGLTFSLSSYLLHGRFYASGPDWSAAAVGIVAAIGISQLSWRYLESKMIRLGHRFSYTDTPGITRPPPIGVAAQ